MRYLGSRKHLAGSVAALVGVVLALAGVGGSLWPLVVVGLYAAAALATPSDPARPAPPRRAVPPQAPAPAATPPARTKEAATPLSTIVPVHPAPPVPQPQAPPSAPLTPPPSAPSPAQSPAATPARPAPPAPVVVEAEVGTAATVRVAGGWAFGLDLGTTYSAAAVWRDGRAEAATLGDLSHVVPSVLFRRADGVVLVGDAAERRAVAEPHRVAREVKRRLGDHVPISLGDTRLTPTELTAHLVRWVASRVAEREGGPPRATVVTHPAGWQAHRLATLAEALADGGLPDAELLPEPVAAATYYASREGLAPGGLIAVYDLGGGTFDATIVRRRPAGEEGFDIVGRPQGDDRLGGVDLDHMLLDLVAAATAPDWPEPSEDPLLLQGLAQVRANVVAAKESLSYDTHAVVPVVLPGLSRQVRITRRELEDLARPALARTVEVLRRTCELAGVAAEDLDSVLLVGGSSRIPLVSELVMSALRRPVSVDAHPKLAVCLGAALAAGARVGSA